LDKGEDDDLLQVFACLVVWLFGCVVRWQGGVKSDKTSADPSGAERPAGAKQIVPQSTLTCVVVELEAASARQVVRRALVLLCFFRVCGYVFIVNEEGMGSTNQ
jgi:hypothetical protein